VGGGGGFAGGSRVFFVGGWGGGGGQTGKDALTVTLYRLLQIALVTYLSHTLQKQESQVEWKTKWFLPLFP